MINIASSDFKRKMHCTIYLLASPMLMGLGLSFMSCAHEYPLERSLSTATSVGEVTYQVLSHEASLSSRASDAKMDRLAQDAPKLIHAIDTWLTWPTLHAIADELYGWDFLYDEPKTIDLLQHVAQHLDAIVTQQGALEILASEALYVRFKALSPYAPHPLASIMSPGFATPLKEMIRWSALHDAYPSPDLKESERSTSLLVLLIYLEDFLQHAQPIPEMLMDVLELLFKELPAHNAPQSLVIHSPYASFAIPFQRLRYEMNVPLWAWDQVSSYQSTVSQDLTASVAYALCTGIGTWWSAGALSAGQDLLEALLPLPSAVPAPLLGGETLAYAHAQNLTPLLQATLDLIDHPMMPALLGYFGAKLPYDEQILAELLNHLENLLNHIDEEDPFRARDPEIRERGFVPDLIEAVADLVLFKEEIRPRSAWSQTDASVSPLLSRKEATLLMVAELMMALDDPVLQELPRVIALMMQSQAPEHESLPPLGGIYDRCALDCEQNHRLDPWLHLYCIETCPRSDLLWPQAPEQFQVQSTFERSLALIRDFAGHGYQMRITHFRSDFFEAINQSQTLDPELLPPLLEIKDVAATFLSSVIGELTLTDLVSPETIGNPQIDLMLDGFDLLCEEGSLSNDILNNLLPSLIEVTEELLNERCQRFIETRSLGEDETAKRTQVAVLVTMLSLLTDVPMSERPRTGELIRFFNLEQPAVYLGILDLELSKLICAEGYPLSEHHGYALYAAEAAGLYQTLSPLIRLAHRYDKLPALARLLGTLYTHYGSDERPFYRADRSHIQSAGTGLVYLEPTLEVLFNAPQMKHILNGVTQLFKDERIVEVGLINHQTQTDAWKTSQWSHTLAYLGISPQAWEFLQARSRALGHPVWLETGHSSTRGALLFGTILERALVPGAGPSAQGRLMALWRAFDYLLSELARAPDREERVRQSFDLIFEEIKLLLVRSSEQGLPHFVSQRPIYVTSAILTWVADQLSLWPNLGQNEFYTKAKMLEDLVSHPVFFSVLSLAHDLRNHPEGKALDALLAPIWADPLSLTTILYQVSAIMTMPRIHELGPLLAPILNPQQTPALPQETLNLLLRMMDSSAWDGWEDLLRKGLLPPSPDGSENLGDLPQAPINELMGIIFELTRKDPRNNGRWDFEDWRVSITEFTHWLTNENTGMVKAITTIRHREH